MPRSDRSPGEYSSHRGTPKKAPPSDRSSDYDSEDDDGPTLFGSILRTLMAGGAVVAIAVLVRVASAFQTRKRGASLRVLAVDPFRERRATRRAGRAPRRPGPRDRFPRAAKHFRLTDAVSRASADPRRNPTPTR
jgi:hypothetical protein